MKKITLVILTAITLLLCVISFYSCENQTLPCIHTDEDPQDGVCDICGANMGGQEGTHTHVPEVDNAVAPTCTEKGKTAGAHCSECGEIIVPQTEVAAIGHIEIIDMRIEPTCTEAGLDWGKHCETCGEILTEQAVIPAKGHTVITDSKTEPTCTESGLTEGTHCEDCKAVLIKQEIIPALGHAEVIIHGTAATCTESGISDGKSCTRCNEVLITQEEISAKGHKRVTDVHVAPTCNEIGLTKGEHCETCGKVFIVQIGIQKLSHIDENYDGNCDRCNEPYAVEYAWDSVELSFMMMVEDSSAELTSTCERYIAGDYSGTKDNIDTAVQKRNEAAYEYAKVNYTDTMYDYFPNTSDYGWGEAGVRIMEQVCSPNAENLPDVYINFVYDMVGASLQGCFANLYATERKNLNGDDVAVNNYFPFDDFRTAFFDYADESEKFNEEEDGQGYMYEYMTSLTLSKQKMFLLASDYFTDLVRAFCVMPVNIALLEELGQDPTLCQDLVGNDGVYTLDDFYEEVYNGDWTYSRLAEFSEAVYKDEQNAGREDLGDTVGFALQLGGLAASGMMYSTKSIIIERRINLDTNAFECSYPATNENLFDLFAAMDELMNRVGVISVRGTEEEKLIAQAPDAQSCIENRFAANKVLFGSVIQVGAFEREVYQSMKEGDGFGVVPIPRYSYEAEDGYFTQIHNVGRIGAISVKTTKFDQCTAFLNYQSTHSGDILEDYYKYKLQYAALAGETGTIDMMNFIRNNLHSNFDKTWEDAIGYFYQDMNKRWHAILISNGFEVPDFRTQYNSLIAEKQARLAALIEVYDYLNN